MSGYHHMSGYTNSHMTAEQAATAVIRAAQAWADNGGNPTVAQALRDAVATHRRALNRSKIADAQERAARR